MVILGGPYARAKTQVYISGYNLKVIGNLLTFIVKGK